MEVYGRWPCPSCQFVGQNYLSFFLFSYGRFLSGSVCKLLSKESIFSGSQCIPNRRLLLSPISTARKGLFMPITEELWNVVWTIEAKLESGQQLYLTGDLSDLGDWQPDMAIQMHPIDNSRLWKAEVKVPFGVNIKYNYFLINEEQNSREIIWRPGPEISLSVPSSGKTDVSLSVRDSWMTWSDAGMTPSIWGDSLVEESFPQSKPSTSINQDRDEIFKVLQLEYPEELENDLNVKRGSTMINGTLLRDMSTLSSGGEDQPIEEPWLLKLTYLPLSSENEVRTGFSSEVGNPILSFNVDSLNSPSKSKQVLVDKKNHIFKNYGQSTTILINTSICTMQRIAVLEDEKLVELLLEPVKSDVQCDSVYLGVVTQLLPHMGGALVDIGSSRPAFMDLDENREPFIIPPFHHKAMNGKNDTSSEVDLHQNFLLRKHPDDIGNDDFVEFFSSHQSTGIIFDDQEDNESTDDFDTLYDKPDNNGSVLDYGKLYANFQRVGKMIGSEGRGGTNSSTVYQDISDPNFSDQTSVSSKDSMVKGNFWKNFGKGTKIIVQVYKEGLGTKRPSVTASPHLRSRFWVLLTRCNRIGVSRKIIGSERLRLKVIAKILQPPGFGLTVRTVAAGQSWKELHKDLKGLLCTWKAIMENAKSAALAADEGVEGSIPVILHRAMGQTLSVVQDYLNETVKKMVVDSPRTYHEVTTYLQDIAPDLCDRVELYDKRNLLFREFKIEEEINSILSKRVPLTNGGSLVIEQTEALVSIDVNGGHVMFGQGTLPAKAVLDVNLAAVKQIARELRLRDIGGIIVVDFIDMKDESNRRLVYEEMKRAVEKDRSNVKVSELSKHGLMEITRKRVRPSVAFRVSEPCTCCQGTGRVEALETIFSKIEQEICRLLAAKDQQAVSELPLTWPRFLLRIDHQMCTYLTSGKNSRLATLSSSLKVWILLKVARGFTRGSFEVKLITDDKSSSGQLRHQPIPMLRQADTQNSNVQKPVKLVTIKKGKGRKSSKKQAAVGPVT